MCILLNWMLESKASEACVCARVHGCHSVCLVDTAVALFVQVPSLLSDWCVSVLLCLYLEVREEKSTVLSFLRSYQLRHCFSFIIYRTERKEKGGRTG